MPDDLDDAIEMARRGTQPRDPLDEAIDMARGTATATAEAPRGFVDSPTANPSIVTDALPSKPREIPWYESAAQGVNDAGKAIGNTVLKSVMGLGMAPKDIPADPVGRMDDDLKRIFGGTTGAEADAERAKIAAANPRAYGAGTQATNLLAFAAGGKALTPAVGAAAGPVVKAGASALGFGSTSAALDPEHPVSAGLTGAAQGTALSVLTPVLGRLASMFGGGMTGGLVKAAAEGVILAQTPVATPEGGVAWHGGDATGNATSVGTMMLLRLLGGRGVLTPEMRAALVEKGYPPEALAADEPKIVEAIKRSAEEEGRFQREKAKASRTPVEAPLERPSQEAPPEPDHLDEAIAMALGARPAPPVDAVSASPEAPTRAVEPRMAGEAAPEPSVPTERRQSPRAASFVAGENAYWRAVREVDGIFSAGQKPTAAAHEAGMAAKANAMENRPPVEAPAPAETSESAPVARAAPVEAPPVTKPKAAPLDLDNPPATWNGGRFTLLGKSKDGNAVYRLTNEPDGTPMAMHYSLDAKGRFKPTPSSNEVREARESAKAPRPDTSQAGMVNPHAFGELAEMTGRAVRRELGSLIGRIRTYATETSTKVADLAQEVVTEAKGNLGKMHAERDAALKAAGRSPLTGAGRDVVGAQGLQWDASGRHATSRFVDLIEGRAEPKNATEADLVAKGRALINKTGEMTEGAGLMQFDARSGEWAPFINKGGEISPRIMTPEMVDVMMKGPKSPAWKRIIDAFAERSGVPRENVEADFLERHDSMVEERTGASPGKRAQAEYRRGYPEVPAAIRLPGGETLSLFETNPYKYFDRLSASRAARLAFTKIVGQDTPGLAKSEMDGVDPTAGTPIEDRPVARLREQFSKETGHPEDFDRLVRGLHGQAVERPIVDPSSALGRTFRAVNDFVINPVKNVGLLSKSVIRNVFEPLGAMRDLGGTGRLVKAIWQIMPLTARGKAATAALETNGSVTHDILNLSIDPSHIARSVATAAQEISGRVFLHRFLNEFQERLGAQVGKIMSSDFRVGKGGEFDVQRLKAGGFSEADARRIVKGGGTDAEHSRIERDLPGGVTGANLSPAEKSMFQHRRWTKTINTIANYAHMTARKMAGEAKAFADTWEKSFDPSLIPSQAWQRRLVATAHYGSTLTGKIAQGAAGSMLAAWVGGGVLGLKIAKNEAEDRTAGFIVDSMVNAAVGGPYASAMNVATGRTEPEDVVFPVFVAKTVRDAVDGRGQYADMDAMERASMLLRRMVPATDAFKSMAVAFGLGSEESRDVETAKKAYWRWRMEASPVPRTSFPDEDAGDAAFREAAAKSVEYRTAIKGAYRAVIAGSSPETVDAMLRRALGVEGKTVIDLYRGIKARRLLHGKAVESRIDALKSRVGADAFKTLERHDETLDELAESVVQGRLDDK